MASTNGDGSGDVLHDEDNGKFYIPFPDKQAVLRYTREDDEIEFQSIFVPPDLREDGLEEQIVQRAYRFVDENNLQAHPGSQEAFFKMNHEHV